MPEEVTADGTGQHPRAPTETGALARHGWDIASKLFVVLVLAIAGGLFYSWWQTRDNTKTVELHAVKIAENAKEGRMIRVRVLRLESATERIERATMQTSLDVGAMKQEKVDALHDKVKALERENRALRRSR